MALRGWIVDKSVAARGADPEIRRHLSALSGELFLCPVGMLEQLYSARSAGDYDVLADKIETTFPIVETPPDIFARALVLQRALAHHQGMWHRTPIPDLLTAETALHHGVGVVHVDRDYERIAEVRPLKVRRLTIA